MMSGNDTSSGVYGVSPYNYLTAQSPVDKHPPQSSAPLHARDSLANVEGEEDPSPYSYLNPNAPAPFHRDGSLLPNEKVKHGAPPAANMRSVGLPRDYTQYEEEAPSDMNTQFYPARRGKSDDEYHLSAMDNPLASERVYNNYDPNNGQLPRTHTHDSTTVAVFNTPGASSGFDNVAQVSPKSRPLADGTFVRENYKEEDLSSGKLRVCGIILLVILCLGVGFAAGWFSSLHINDDDQSCTTGNSQSTTAYPNTSPSTTVTPFTTPTSSSPADVTQATTPAESTTQ